MQPEKSEIESATEIECQQVNRQLYEDEMTARDLTEFVMFGTGPMAPKRKHPSQNPIDLVCANCGRTIAYARTIDPDIPTNVVRIEQPHCDGCWDGDREGETWFDGAGNEVSQDV